MYAIIFPFFLALYIHNTKRNFSKILFVIVRLSMSISKRGCFRRILIKRADAFSGCPVCTFDMSYRMLSIIYTLAAKPTASLPRTRFQVWTRSLPPVFTFHATFPSQSSCLASSLRNPYSQKLRTIWVDSNENVDNDDGDT